MSLDYLLLLLPSMLRGLAETLKIFFLTVIFAVPLGLPFALGSMSKIPPFKWLSRAYIWLFRGTPLLLQLFFFYFMLPQISPALRFDRFVVAVFTFALNYAAYFAEIYRAGIESIDRGQWEASKSLGFTRWQTMRIIIIPQTVKRVIPPLSNEIITLVKDTALVTVISVSELLKSAKDAVNRDVNPFAYLVAAVFYLVIIILLTIVSLRLEKRFSRHEAKLN